MNKQIQNNIKVRSDSFNAGLKDLKKLTGSFNAGLKDLKKMAAKQAAQQSQAKNNNNAKQ
ncbi:hypothetical protein OQH61_09100 [Helicobacter sp. MIT 21-1697]|uniref:hypothetical protein n=1 Tax=Helicobacter sp. MIT 21-1697 TaxID=2993733 RepID=UPI00224B7E71|nr:hypothetical protein [Helicobacter sp. MIT 21-1697]MCX2717889.1 hypothetical protein [Helicobacter sp. MIT 21-1697]